MAKQYAFGSGVLWGYTTDDAVNTPYQFGVLQECSVDFDASVKELFGQFQYPVAVGRGTSKITGKAKFGQIQGKLLGSLFFNESTTNGQVTAVNNEAGAVPAVSTYTVTVSGSATWTQDRGVMYAATGVPLTRVASGPTAGQYSAAAGVYTFAAADASAAVLISYIMTVASLGENFTITNQLLGTAPIFGITLQQTYGVNTYTLQLNQCISSKLSLPTKLEDFLIQEFDFSAFADSSNNVGVLSMTSQY